MLKRAKKLVGDLHQNTSGAMSIEKILIVALIALPIIIVLVTFRGKIVEWFNSTASSLDH